MLAGNLIQPPVRLSGQKPQGQAAILYEPGHNGADVAAAERIDKVRKFVDFVEDFPALKRVAMLLHVHDMDLHYERPLQ